MSGATRVSVAVLVELERGPGSGGHVKCWERLAYAAAGAPGIDLTVYLLGPRHRMERIAGNVRFVELPPVWSTRRMGALVGGVDPSDVVPYHRGLARLLPRHDVWHLTHSLAFASTAVRAAPGCRRPLVGSVHTDVPTLARMYTRRLVEGLPPGLRGGLRWAGVERAPAAVARHRRDRLLGACDHVLVSSDADRREIAAAVPGVPLSRLRRGIDTSRFHPGRADRGWLARHHRVPGDRPLVLFVGRVDVTKGAATVAEAVQRMNASGRRAHLVVAGDGRDTGRVSSLLDGDVSLLGTLPQSELARVYASCDLLAFPSVSETAGNVVAEAMASGLPVVLPDGAATAQWLAARGQDGMLVTGGGADAWARALDALVADPARRRAMGRRARATAEDAHPSWVEVLREDLLPVWRAVRPGAGSDLRGSRRAPPGVGDRVPPPIS